jgi:quercetin dioxygenase-like cupin family protein
MSLAVRDPDQGSAYDFAGARFVVKATGSATAGQLAVMEMLCPAALDVPGHVHEGEDEMFYVLSGELSGFCGPQRWSASPGAFVLLPRDVEHGFAVTSACDARVLVIVGPPRFDAHVAERGTRVVLAQLC